MTHRQQNHPIAADLPGGLSVYVARWPQRPDYPEDQPKPPRVCWRDNGTYRYLPPSAARAFGMALVEAADEIEREVP